MRACARCGDFLHGPLRAPRKLCAPCEALVAPPPTIPFEDGTRPLVARYFATVFAVLLRPSRAFANTPDDPRRALVFGVPGGLAGTGLLALTTGATLVPPRPALAWPLLLAIALALLGATTVALHAIAVVARGRGGPGRSATVSFYVAGASAWLVAIPGGGGIALAFALYLVASALGLASAHRERAG